jgi:RHS repeat-associated protein
MKQVSDPDLDEAGHREHYVRDAQGNIMATYRYTNTAAASLKLNERPLYGSSRLGSLRTEVELRSLPSFDPTSANPVQQVDLNYELTDHLGNVCAVVTGRLLDGNGGGTPKQAELVSAQGYEAFGSLLPGRNYSSESYRFGFNGKENDDEVHGATGTFQDYGMRAYDTRLGRPISVDPIASSFPELSPYQFYSNNPVLNIDLDGLEGTVNQSGYLAFGVFFDIGQGNQGRGEPQLVVTSTLSLSAGVARTVDNVTGLATLNVRGTQKGGLLSTTFSSVSLSGMLGGGFGDNSDMDHNLSLMRSHEFMGFGRNSNVGEGSYVGGGLSFQLDAKGYRGPATKDDRLSFGKLQLGAFAQAGRREGVLSLSSSLGGPTTSPLGNPLSARTYSLGARVNGLLGGNPSVDVGASLQTRREGAFGWGGALQANGIGSGSGDLSLRGGAQSSNAARFGFGVKLGMTEESQGATPSVGAATGF